VKFKTIFINFMQNGADAGGEWAEFPFQPGQEPDFTFTSPTTGDGPITISNIGFQLSDTMIPLDDLNSVSDPPPGMPGSTFTPMAPPLVTSEPGVPEPSSLCLLSLGAAAGWLLRRR